MVFLGQASNYSAGQVWRQLFAWGTQRDFTALKSRLADRYGVEQSSVTLFHTGRSALTAAIKAVAPQGKVRVIIPGLTCIAVVRAVRAAGCEPVFVDITPETLEYDYAKLEKALQPIDKNDKVCYNGSIILIQNTLGIPWQVQKIEKLAQKYQAKIVEDLAHSAGRFYADGREIGSVGDAAALSFGKGKAIDTISGGAAIIRHNADFTTTLTPPQPTQKPKFSDRCRDRWYPLFGALARVLWKSGVGQVLIGGLVKIDFVQRSADAELDLSRRLTYWQAKLALRQLNQLPNRPLRDFRLVRDRTEVLSKLQQEGYYLQEIWYDTPVSPARYAAEADFPTAECPQTVRIAEQIINLPTWYPAEKLARAYEIIKPYELKSAEQGTPISPQETKFMKKAESHAQKQAKNDGSASSHELKSGKGNA